MRKKKTTNINDLVEEKLANAKTQSERDAIMKAQLNYGFLEDNISGEITQKITKYNKIREKTAKYTKFA